MTTDQLGDPDIVRGARYIIERYGQQAILRTQLRRAELQQMGEHSAAAIWNQIAAATRLLLAEKETAKFLEDVPRRHGAPMRRYQLVLIGTSGQMIGVEVSSSADDEQATHQARKLFAEYPLVSEIEIRHQNAVVARIIRDKTS